MSLATRDGAWLVAGSLLVTAGSGLAGVYAFENRVSVVAVGFLLFFVGYRTAQFGVHRDHETPLGDALRRSLRSAARRERARRGACLAVGLVGIAYGVTLFSQTIVDPDLSRAAFSGLWSIGGYMFAHVGMNERLL